MTASRRQVKAVGYVLDRLLDDASTTIKEMLTQEKQELRSGVEWLLQELNQHPEPLRRWIIRKDGDDYPWTVYRSPAPWKDDGIDRGVFENISDMHASSYRTWFEAKTAACRGAWLDHYSDVKRHGLTDTPWMDYPRGD